MMHAISCCGWRKGMSWVVELYLAEGIGKLIICCIYNTCINIGHPHNYSIHTILKCWYQFFDILPIIISLASNVSCDVVMAQVWKIYHPLVWWVMVHCVVWCCHHTCMASTLIMSKYTCLGFERHEIVVHVNTISHNWNVLWLLQVSLRNWKGVSMIRQWQLWYFRVFILVRYLYTGVLLGKTPSHKL